MECPSPISIACFCLSRSTRAKSMWLSTRAHSNRGTDAMRVTCTSSKGFYPNWLWMLIRVPWTLLLSWSRQITVFDHEKEAFLRIEICRKCTSLSQKPDVKVAREATEVPSFRGAMPVLVICHLSELRIATGGIDRSTGLERFVSNHIFAD